MANSTTISTGVKITVDASDIKNKFTKSVDELNKSLSKNQKALGLVYNEQGVLTNALGQTVEGLSQSAIKLGQYVDGLGRVRTYQGGFIDGLTKTQIELGQYADELGNLYNKYGDWIGVTEKATRAQEAETAALEKQRAASEALSRQTLESFVHASEGLAHTAGQFAIFTQLVDNANGTTSEFSKTISTTANSISVASSAFKASAELIKGLTETAKNLPSLLSNVTTTASSTTVAVNGLGAAAKGTGVAMAALGGPITMAVSAIAAVAAGIAAFKSSTQTTLDLSESFQRLLERAKAAGVEIRSVADALNVGAFAAPVSELNDVSQKVLDARDAFKSAVDSYNQAQQAAIEASAASGRYVGGPSRKSFNLDQLESDWKNAVAEYNDVVAQYVEEARKAQQTEQDKINEQKKTFETLLRIAQKTGNQENATLFSNQIKALDDKLLAIRQKEIDETTKAAEAEKQRAETVARQELETRERIRAELIGVDETTKRLADWANALEKGIVNQSEYNSAVAEIAERTKSDALTALGIDLPSANQSFDDKSKRLAELLDDGIINQSEYESALEQLTDAARSAIPGFNDLFNDSALDDYKSTLTQLDAAFKSQLITADQRDKLLDEASNKLAKARDEQARREGVNAERDKARAALGVDSVLESLKTPLDKYREQLERIAEAARAGYVNESERIALTQKAAETYIKTLNDGASDVAEQIVSGKYETASSYSAGSESLYLAQVRNSTANYQSAIQTSTSAIERTSAEALNYSRTSAQLLETIADSMTGQPTIYAG